MVKKEDLEQALSTYMQELRYSKKAEGQDRIYTHGENEMEMIAVYTGAQAPLPHK